VPSNPLPTNPAYLPSLAAPGFLFPHRVDIQINTPTTRDTAGAPVPNWTAQSTNVPAMVGAAPQGERDDFARRGLEVTHLIQIPPLPPDFVTHFSPWLPPVAFGNRIVFGTRPGGSTPRTFQVQEVANEGEMGVLLSVWCLERLLT